jgi:hypothetical protein
MSTPREARRRWGAQPVRPRRRLRKPPPPPPPGLPSLGHHSLRQDAIAHRRAGGHGGLRASPAPAAASGAAGGLTCSHCVCLQSPPPDPRPPDRAAGRLADVPRLRTAPAARRRARQPHGASCGAGGRPRRWHAHPEPARAHARRSGPVRVPSRTGSWRAFAASSTINGSSCKRGECDPSRQRARASALSIRAPGADGTARRAPEALRVTRCAGASVRGLLLRRAFQPAVCGRQDAHPPSVRVCAPSAQRLAGAARSPAGCPFGGKQARGGRSCTGHTHRSPSCRLVAATHARPLKPDTDV